MHDLCVKHQKSFEDARPVPKRAQNQHVPTHTIGDFRAYRAISIIGEPLQHGYDCNGVDDVKQDPATPANSIPPKLDGGLPRVGLSIGPDNF